MRKDFAKRKLSAKQASVRRWGWIFFAFAAAIFFLAAGCLIFQYKEKMFNTPFISSFFSRAQIWIAARKNHLQKGVVRDTAAKTQSFAVSKHQAPAPIHFEFYTALPNMQVTLPAPVMEVQKKEDRVAAVKKSPAVNKVVVVSAEELEKELSRHFMQNTYVLQLGVFRHAASADSYHKTLAAAGFDASIITLRRAEKETYRVQLGPFLNKVQAKEMQRKLLEKGMEGVILKTGAG